jgi:polar amino acid transport system substrate-binding protein
VRPLRLLVLAAALLAAAPVPAPGVETTSAETTAAETTSAEAPSAGAAAPAGAEPAAVLPRPGQPLRVGTKQAPPFALRDPETGAWRGLSIDLWQRVADRLGVRYELVEDDLPGLLAGVRQGEVDVAVAALTVTSAREETMDFSHPFHTSGLAIGVGSRHGAGTWALARRVLSPNLAKVLGLLALVLLAAGALVWLAERRRNEDFGGRPLAGLGSGFWWAAVTMTTVGYGDKAPRTFAGRAIALVWMFASVITISGFTAAIASSLTLAGLALPVEGPDDLGRVSVATVERSTSQAYLAERGVDARAFPDIASALAAVADGEPVAVVYDRPILRWLARREHAEAIELLPAVFERQDYAFALPPGSPWREPINRALLEEIADPAWQERVADYLGEEP